MSRLTYRDYYLSTLKYLFSSAVIDAGYPTRLADIRPLYARAVHDASRLCAR